MSVSLYRKISWLTFRFLSLIGAVEACLLHGLKKRALGLFKHGTTTALLQKIAKNFEPAAQVAKLVAEAEASSSADNVSK